LSRNIPRIHRTLKLEATKPPAGNILQQQEKFYGFIKEYNYERPHMDYELGYFDEFSRTFSPKIDPFGIKLDDLL